MQPCDVFPVVFSEVLLKVFSDIILFRCVASFIDHLEKLVKKRLYDMDFSKYNL
jgi:hypothetical protein